MTTATRCSSPIWVRRLLSRFKNPLHLSPLCRGSGPVRRDRDPDGDPDQAGAPLSGKTVAFTLDEGGTITPVGTATTNASGVATLTGVSLAGFNAGTFAGAVGASFAGDSTDAASSASGDLTVSPAQATSASAAWSSPTTGRPRGHRQHQPRGPSGVTVTYTQNDVAVAAPTHAGSYSSRPRSTIRTTRPPTSPAPWSSTRHPHQRPHPPPRRRPAPHCRKPLGSPA